MKVVNVETLSVGVPGRSLYQYRINEEVVVISQDEEDNWIVRRGLRPTGVRQYDYLDVEGRLEEVVEVGRVVEI